MKNYFLIVLLLMLSFYLNAKSDYIIGDTFEPWEGGNAYFSKWTKGPSANPNYFLIGTWYQEPNNAVAYKNLGFNYNVFCWSGNDLSPMVSAKVGMVPPTTEMLSNLGNPNTEPAITSWIYYIDEPDNVQSSGNTVDPSTVISAYNNTVIKDQNRPVYLSLGAGVAQKDWWGRGAATGDTASYRQYAKGADILQFDIYPMNTYKDATLASFKQPYLNAVGQNPGIIGAGVDNLRRYSDYKKPVIACLESTNYEGDSRYTTTPTAYIRPEAWIAIIHGARGLLYFCHLITPNFVEPGLLNDAAMSAEVKKNNELILAHSPILNTQTVSNAVTMKTSNKGLSSYLKSMVKRYQGFTYIYSVIENGNSTTGTFTLRGFTGASTIEVVGENRTITATNGVFTDTFSNWDVHIYKVATQGDISGVSNVTDENTVKIRTLNSTIEIESIDFFKSYDIFNINGQRLFTQNVDGYKSVFSKDIFADKVLFVKLNFPKKTIVRKIINI